MDATKLIFSSTIKNILDNNTLEDLKTMQFYEFKRSRRLKHIIPYIIHYDWLDLCEIGEFENMRVKQIDINKSKISTFISTDNTFLDKTQLIS
jgi:hypothetical protein